MNIYHSFYKDHFVPDTETKYFLPHYKNKKKSIIGVVFPFFNEEVYELTRSFRSIYKQQEQCEISLKTEFYYVAIMDGWSKASESVKEYITKLFPYDEENNWLQHLETKEDDTNIGTLILQKTDANGMFDYMNV